MGPAPSRRRARARARCAAPAIAALRMSCATPCATPSWISGSGALACPRRRTSAGGCAGEPGESARLIAGAATCSPSRPSSAPRPSACASPLNAQPAEQVDSQPTACASKHDRILAGRQLGGLARAPAALRRGALGERARVERRRAATELALGVPAAPVRRDADHLHERVGASLGARPPRRSPSPAPARRPSRCRAPRRRARSRHGERGGRVPRRRRPDRARRWRGRSLRARAAAPPAGRSPGSAPPRSRAAASAASRARARRSRRARRRRRRSSRRAHVPVERNGDLARSGRRSRSTASAARRRSAASASARVSRGRARRRPARPASARSASSSGRSRHARPRRRGSARARVPCETRITCPGSPLPQSSSEISRHSDGRADRVAAAPELGRHARVARVAQQPPALAVPDLPGASPSNWKWSRRLSIDHERFVSIRRPSSVSAIRSSRLPASPGLEVHVRHPHDRLAGEAVGAHAAAGAVEPDLGRGLARGQEAAQHAVAHDRHGPPLHALVVPAEAAEAARVGGVGRHVHPLGAEAERADAVGAARSSCRRRRPRAPSTRSSSTAWPTDSCT